ncbi:MAG: ATP synthase F1 subunit gamma [Proteobacteria bacterium]|nr:MAG: ATP synthase F1 subunit gamma [Pseudomonadota bacterium]
MAGLKEIKRRLRSVRNTKKITYAMKLVSAAKLRKAQDAVISSRAYTNQLNALLKELVEASGAAGFTHPLMEVKDNVTKIGVLVIGGQRGLCGGYNSNLHKKVEAFFKQNYGAITSVTIGSIVLGKKPADFYRRTKKEISKSYEDLPENANAWPIEEVSRTLERGFIDGRFDEVYIIYTRFRSAISQVATAEKLLPLDAEAGLVGGSHAKEQGTHESKSMVTMFEPSVREVFSAVIPRILSTKIRQARLDAKASETASRMTAMDSATKNAGQLIRKLELTHNKLRQLQVTSQLLDIIGGAEALK